MAILPITNKYASWPAKVDHEAYFCYFSLSVRMNGGGEGSRTIFLPPLIFVRNLWPFSQITEVPVFLHLQKCISIFDRKSWSKTMSKVYLDFFLPRFYHEKIGVYPPLSPWHQHENIAFLTLIPGVLCFLFLPDYRAKFLSQCRKQPPIKAMYRGLSLFSFFYPRDMIIPHFPLKQAPN